MHPQLSELIDVCAKHGVTHVVLAGGLPPGGAIDRIKAQRRQAGLLRSGAGLAKKLMRSGADALVIEGMEAGGHIGPVATSVLAQEILPHRRPDIPVFVAGGIGRGEAIAAYLEISLGTTLLTLRSYTFFDTLRTLGLDGADTFNVTTAASGPSRDLFVDGGLASGKKKSTDNLNIFYTPPRPRIIHSAETQDPDAGIVDLDYGSARYVVQYDDIEQVTIKRI